MTPVGIHSDLTVNEAEGLKRYAAAVPADGVILEIGTGCGGTAVLFSKATEATIYTIDPYPLLDNINLLNTHGIRTCITISKEASKLWDSEPIDLLLIDGGHDLKSLVTDIQCWFPYLATGAIVIIDDYEAESRGGVANLAVKICLDTLLSTGVLEQVTREKKMLVSHVLREVGDSDIRSCYRHFKNLDSEDGTDRAKCEKLALQLPQDFWKLYMQAVDKLEFRKSIETYSMLQLTRGHREYDRLDWLSREIAFKQVELNCLRKAVNAFSGEER